MCDCPIHGFSGTLIYSSDLLELLPDGRLPEVIIVEVATLFLR